MATRLDPIVNEYGIGWDSPGRGAAAVTPNDGADLTRYARRLYIGGTGDVKVDMIDGSTVTFASVPAGELNISSKRVYSTGTTATNIVAIF